jgi:hypothetical protein
MGTFLFSTDYCYLTTLPDALSRKTVKNQAVRVGQPDLAGFQRSPWTSLKKVALRSVPRLSAFGGQVDARYAISIFVHAHVAPKIIEFYFAASAAKICDAFLPE